MRPTRLGGRLAVDGTARIAPMARLQHKRLARGTHRLKGLAHQRELFALSV
jgi:hypothetical protein